MIQLTQEEASASYPLVHATVHRLIERSPIQGPESFKKSTLVRIATGSKFFGLDSRTNGIGEIVLLKPEEPGWAYVRFPAATPEERFTNRYRIGDPEIEGGVCDLEFAEAEKRTYAIIVYGGQTVEIQVTGFKLEAGDVVKIDPKSAKVVAVEKAVPSGNIAFIYRIIDAGFVEVDFQGHRRTVFSGKFGGKLEANGRVVLDASGTVILENYGLDDDSFAVAEDTLVTWDDVCGQEDAKSRFREALEMHEMYPKTHAAYRMKAPNGFLLWGPPGCSKTMLGKAVYSSMAALCKAKGAPISQGFILISGPEILDKYVGAAEGTIRHIFARARKFYRKWGIRPVIMIDEAEAILAKRDSGISSDVLRSIVPAFLSQMDGVRESGAIVILATNKPGILDSAVIRPGRIDAQVEIKRPDRPAVREIFVKNMKGIPIAKDSNLDMLADLLVNEVFSEKRNIFQIDRVADTGKEMETVYFRLSDIVSGAMVPAIVKEVKRLAILRDRTSSLPDGQVSGIGTVDIIAAVDSMYQQSFASDHREALGDFTQSFGDRIRGVTKLIQIR
ncbi:MAG: AAA family ATPase [Patescibacteria group bacterium]